MLINPHCPVLNATGDENTSIKCLLKKSKSEYASLIPLLHDDFLWMKRIMPFFYYWWINFSNSKLQSHTLLWNTLFPRLKEVTLSSLEPINWLNSFYVCVLIEDIWQMGMSYFFQLTFSDNIIYLGISPRPVIPIV